MRCLSETRLDDLDHVVSLLERFSRNRALPVLHKSLLERTIRFMKPLEEQDEKEEDIGAGVESEAPRAKREHGDDAAIGAAKRAKVDKSKKANAVAAFVAAEPPSGVKVRSPALLVLVCAQPLAKQRASAASPEEEEEEKEEAEAEATGAE
jgi:hypothetical protein